MFNWFKKTETERPAPAFMVGDKVKLINDEGPTMLVEKVRWQGDKDELYYEVWVRYYQESEMNFRVTYIREELLYDFISE